MSYFSALFLPTIPAKATSLIRMQIKPHLKTLPSEVGARLADDVTGVGRARLAGNEVRGLGLIFFSFNFSQISGALI